MRAESPALGEALMACDFPLVTFIRQPPAWLIVLANQAVAELIGLPTDDLIGRDLGELLSPRKAFETAAAALLDTAVEGVRAERQLLRFGGDPVKVTAWGRAVELDGRRGVIALFVPTGDVGRLGRDPVDPLRNLAAVAVGVADAQWVISHVSADIANVLGGAASEWSGESLIGLVHPDDAPRFPGPVHVEGEPRVVHHVRFRHRDGSWVDVCPMVARDPRGRGTLFALIGPSTSPDGVDVDRVADLESHLRRIGLEVRAAGVLDTLESLPAAGELPQLAELTTRQWEILSRLRRGERVPTIATELYVSPSTVRNHLTAIFRKFGVHSQAELLGALRSGPSDRDSG